MSLFYAVAIIVIVVSPLLVPLTITGVHGLANWRRRYGGSGPQAHTLRMTEENSPQAQERRCPTIPGMLGGLQRCR